MKFGSLGTIQVKDKFSLKIILNEKKKKLVKYFFFFPKLRILNYFFQIGLGNEITHQFRPVLLMSDPQIKSIHCATNFSFIIKNDGCLFFGSNKYGQSSLGKFFFFFLKKFRNKPIFLKRSKSWRKNYHTCYDQE